MKQRLRCRKKLEAEWDAYIDEIACDFNIDELTKSVDFK